MKLAIVTSATLPVPPVLGGAIQQIIFETAQAIRHPKLSVVSPWDGTLQGTVFERSDVFYHVDVEAQAAQVRTAFGGRLPGALARSGLARDFCYMSGVTDLLGAIDPDVIEAHVLPRWAPYLLDRFPAKRLVLYLHGDYQFLFYPDTPQAELVRRVYRFVFVSRFLRGLFVSLYPEAAARTRVIHNSVDTDLWHPGLKACAKTDRVRARYGLKPDRTVLFVGRTVPEKGLHCLVEAMRAVRRELPGAKLLVVGSPNYGAKAESPYLEALRRRASGMGGGVVFAGYVAHRETPFVYGAADVTVVPSLWNEGFGLVAAESMAAGVPVVASRAGGIPEIVDDGVSGVLVKNPMDTAELAHHIVALLKDGDRRLRMGVAAREKVERCFSKWDRLRRVRALYALLEQDAGRRPAEGDGDEGGADQLGAPAGAAGSGRGD